MTFLLSIIESLEEFIDVIKDKVVFEDADHVGLLIVNQIVDHFQIFKFNMTVSVFASQILHYQVFRWHWWWTRLN